MSGAVRNAKAVPMRVMKDDHERWHTGATLVAHRRLALVPIAPLWRCPIRVMMVQVRINRSAA